MAKKITKQITQEPKKEVITWEDILKLAKEKSYSGLEDIYYIQEWLRKTHGLHGEIFYSLFHKKWSINNYFINIFRGERINWDYKPINYDSYDDALLITVYNLLLCV